MNSMKSCFNKYASTVSVTFNSVTYTGKAFITPLRYRNRMYLGDSYERVGQYDSGRYLYVGMPDIRLDLMDETAVVNYGGEAYYIRRAELFCIGDKAQYMWAVLNKCEGSELINESYG